MNRIKVINEPADLVQLLRAVDTKVKREVFKEVAMDWRTTDEIKKKFGKPGEDCLTFFEKMKLVETRWQSEEGDPNPKKAYHSYYSSFNIQTSCPVMEISDILAAAVMRETEYKKFEKSIADIVGEDGKFVGDIAEAVGISPTLLKGLVKRSTKLEYRGHRVEKFREQ